ncbi:hypothetical protein V8F06_014396 [Rhypophila decipiens]
METTIPFFPKFLDFPAEIRPIIWVLAFQEPLIHHINIDDQEESDRVPGKFSLPPISYTNHWNLVHTCRESKIVGQRVRDADKKIHPLNILYIGFSSNSPSLESFAVGFRCVVQRLGPVTDSIRKIALDANGWYLYDKGMIMEALPSLVEISVPNRRNIDITFDRKEYCDMRIYKTWAVRVVLGERKLLLGPGWSGYDRSVIVGLENWKTSMLRKFGRAVAVEGKSYVEFN